MHIVRHRCSILSVLWRKGRAGAGRGKARRTSRRQGQFSSTNFETGQPTSSSCNVLQCVAGITSWSLQMNAEQRKRIINPCFKGGHKHVAVCHRNKEKRTGEALWLRDPTAENGKSIYGAILFPARPQANAHITYGRANAVPREGEAVKRSERERSGRNHLMLRVTSRGRRGNSQVLFLALRVVEGSNPQFTYKLMFRGSSVFSW